MKRFRFIEKGLCCDVFYEKERSIHSCALFLYGFPATIGANRITEILVDKGYTVLQPHYYGTYDSDGNFTPQSAFATVKSMKEIVEHANVRDLKTNHMTTIPNKITLCIGYSFGAYVLKHSVEHLTDLQTILLFSPVMSNNPDNDSYWFIEDGLEHLKYCIRTRPFTYRIIDKADWIEKYVYDKNIANTNFSNLVRRVLWIYGENDVGMISERLNNRFKDVTSKYFGRTAISDIICVNNGGHSINSLVTEDTVIRIEEVL